ncbi:hypothetical protein E4U54_001036 [Claviceps lovelessii]|nr:hypothetical protein E4U54_001036 [Claviceps lovelessii]
MSCASIQDASIVAAKDGRGQTGTARKVIHATGVEDVMLDVPSSGERPCESRQFQSDKHMKRPLATWTTDGVKFLGRKDQMTKNRGYFIKLETGVIPAILSQDHVNSATAVMHRQRMIAFVTLITVNGDHVRQEMACRFDQFLVPDETQSRAKLPQTINGKVDNMALQAELKQRDAKAWH